MNKIRLVERSIKLHQAQLSLLHQELIDAVKKSLWKCPRCKKSSKISSIKLKMPLEYSYIDEEWRETQLEACCPKCHVVSWPGMARENFETILKYRNLLKIERTC